MLNNLPAVDKEKISQLEQALEAAQGILAVTELRRNICLGYKMDGDDENYRRDCDRFAQAKQQLAEAKNEIAASPNQRRPLLRLIQALRAM